MNVFRITGDFIHLTSFLILIFRIWTYKTCAGISGKSQLLLALVYPTRYADLIYTYYLSAYNNEFKILFIILSLTTVAMIYFIYRESYSEDVDTFRCELLPVLAALLSLTINYELTALEYFWSFSIFLEAVAMWPQFYLIWQTRTVTIGVFFYLFAIGLYRSLYIFNWIYRYFIEEPNDPISYVSGAVQVIPFVIFWILCGLKGIDITRENLKLTPVEKYDPLNTVEANIQTGEPNNTQFHKNILLVNQSENDIGCKIKSDIDLPRPHKDTKY